MFKNPVIHCGCSLIFRQQEGAAFTYLPLLARFVFASVLMMFFINSGITKFDGLFSPSAGAFVQIFPKAFEAVGYDSSQMSIFAHLIAILGGYAEIILPVLIVIGLFTRLAALGMVGFTLVMSLVDIYGHNVAAKTAGSMFDNLSNGLVFDQRMLWLLLFIQLIIMGGGKLSVDYLIHKSCLKQPSE